MGVLPVALVSSGIAGVALYTAGQLACELSDRIYR